MRTEGLHEARIASPIGEIMLVWDAAGLRTLDFSDFEPRMRLLLRRYVGPGDPVPADPDPVIVGAIAAYFDGDLHALDGIAVATGGTLFQRSVWAALRAIPPGTATTYGAIAAQVGRPAAVRAVGQANGANPVAIAIPCHRVIGANATLTGYGGGLERKRWLLDHERRHASASQGG